jgi:Domain of unknown function (DUF4395)
MSARQMVDPRGPRFTAGLTSVTLSAVLLSGSWPLLAGQALLFGLCALVGVQANPYGMVYRSFIHRHLPVTTEREDAAPLRFAQGVGFVFTTVGVVGYLTSLTWLGIGMTAAALLAALLNAAFGLCLGCELFLAIQLLHQRMRGRNSETLAAIAQP